MESSPNATVRPRRWDELSSPALDRLLAEDPDLVGLIPVGATEQHGPHLPTGTDTILATALSEALSQATGAVVLPALPIGASRWHGTGWAGTLALAGEEVAHLSAEAATWAHDSGLHRLLFVNGHVGNSAPLRLACDRLRFGRAGLRVGVLEWWGVSAAVAEEAVLDAEDWHANRAETSLMLALRPDLVDLAAARTADDDDRATGRVFSYSGAECTTNGVTGKPSQASVELGQRLWKEILTAATALVSRARVEQPPLG